MNRMQWLRLLSFSGAFLIGIWLPLEFCGYLLSETLVKSLDVAVSLVAGIHLYVYAKDKELNFKTYQAWLEPIVLLDILCIIPFNYFSISLFSFHATWLLFLNLPCLIHVRHVKDFLNEFPSLSPMAYRLIPILLGLPILVHVTACGWIYMGGGTASLNSDHVTSYIKALYWAVTTLTTVGYGDITPVTNAQMLYAGGLQIVGVGVFGFILSNVASLLSRADAAREHHMDNLDKVETFLKTHQIPTELKAKTRAYYHYLWKNKKGYQDNSLLEGLPNKLQSELFFQINKSIIDKVPFLKEASQELIEELMDGLEPHIYVPSERVFKFGEEANAIYFIHSGKINILDQNDKLIASLHDGDFFGEMAILNDRPRSATALATSFCDVYSLHKKTFYRVIENHPQFKDHIEKVIKKRLKAA